MPQGTFIVIVAGLVSALLSTTATFGSGVGLFFAYFALLPILLIGLSQGRRAATIAASIAVISALVLSSHYQGLMYFLSVAFPAWLIVYTALTPKTKNDLIPIGEIISRLTVFGAIVLIMSSIFFIDKPNDLALGVEAFLKKIIAHNRPDIIITQNDQILIKRIVPLFPAIAVSSWLLMTFINTLAAQTILIKAKANLKPAFKYSEITAPEWIYWLIVGSVLLILVGSDDIVYIGRNLSLILLIPLFFIGLGVIHKLSSQLRTPAIGLIIFYFLMIISSWPAYIALFLGFFERWTNFRDRINSLPSKD